MRACSARGARRERPNGTTAAIANALERGMRRHEAAGARRGKAAPAQSAGQELLRGACLLLRAARVYAPRSQRAAAASARARLIHPRWCRAEGQRLQQQGERNKDAAACCPVFAAAAEKFRQALQHPLSEEDGGDAAFGMVRVCHCAPRFGARLQRKPPCP